MADFSVRFLGVRGSIATPGTHTAAVGGNTSCVEVMAGGQRIVFDAGTGLRTLGNELVRAGRSHTTLLLSHVHWDHIQGFPFFVPIYIPGHRVDVMSGPNGCMSLEEVLQKQMSPPVFPVTLDEVRSQVSIRDLHPGERFRIGDVDVRVAKLNHPDPVYAFRLDFAGRSVVYATDTEHFSCVDPTLRELARGADILIYDSQYTPEEYSGQAGPAKVGWGHSTYVAACELAQAAEVGQLVLFHHDPERSDEGVAEIESRAQELFAETTAAREGAVIELAAKTRSKPTEQEEVHAA